MTKAKTHLARQAKSNLLFVKERERQGPVPTYIKILNGFGISRPTQKLGVQYALVALLFSDTRFIGYLSALRSAYHYFLMPCLTLSSESYQITIDPVLEDDTFLC